MLLRAPKRIDDIIVLLLGSRAGASASWLCERVREEYRPCTLQGIYHELRKLQKLGVVIKVKDSYHLSISWASELMQFADDVYDNYIGSATALAILPDDGQTYSWQFSSLLRLDDFWMQAMQVMFSETKSPQLFAWNPYPWFYFAQPEKVLRYYDFLKRENRRIYYILGAETFLSRRYAEGVSAEIFEYSFAEPPFTAKDSTYITCVAPYVLSVTLDPMTSKRVANLFDSIKSESMANFVKINGVLNQAAKLKISIQNNDKKAKRLEKSFRDFFGAPVP